MWPILEILVENPNFGRKYKFWSKIQILVENPNSGRISKSGRISNSGRISKSGRKSKFCSKIQILVKYRTYLIENFDNLEKLAKHCIPLTPKLPRIFCPRIYIIAIGSLRVNFNQKNAKVDLLHIWVELKTNLRINFFKNNFFPKKSILRHTFLCPTRLTAYIW